MSEIAGISNPYLSQIERGLRRPSAEILQQIAKALRISAETLYVQAGILEPGTGQADLARDVLADPFLTEEQKQALIRIYLSFRHENEARQDADTDHSDSERLDTGAPETGAPETRAVDSGPVDSGPAAGGDDAVVRPASGRARKDVRVTG
jgi:transcriptional regulator with XRE-family HTH domain